MGETKALVAMTESRTPLCYKNADALRIKTGEMVSKDSCKNFERRLANNESSEIPYAWDEFVSSLKNSREYKELDLYGLATEQNTKILAKEKYKAYSGSDINTDIERNTHGNFVSGFYNGITFGIAQDKSTDQVKKEILDINEPRGAAVTRTIGSVAGGAAVGAAIGSIVPGVGTAIGAGVGAVCGFISKLWS